jgi:hypothetical protein
VRTRIDASEPDDSEPEELTAWIAAGFDEEAAEVWRRWRFTIPRAEAWIEAGVTGGLEAAQWMTAAVDPTSVPTWRDAGIEASEAVQWHEMGYDVDRARTEKAKGLGPTEAFAQSQGQTGRASSSVARLQLSGPVLQGPMGARRGFLGTGVDPRIMHGYLQRQWADEQAMTWAKQGIEAPDAYTWHALGLTPVEAGRLALQGRMPGELIREWWSAGIPYDEVADWIGAGLTAPEAVDQRSKGITSEQAAALRALRQQESGPAPDSPLGVGALTPQGPPGSEIPGPPPEDEESAREQVTSAFAAMLDVDEDGSIAAIDGGSNLGASLAEAAQRHNIEPDTSARTVEIDAVRFINDHEARVAYSVVLTGRFSGTPLLRGRPGRAVLIDGAWKVARDTFCAFMQTAGVECPPREDG